MKIVEVAFDIPVDKTFYYLPGKFSDNIQQGVRVRVPFGRQNKTGIVVSVKNRVNIEGDYKEIIKVYDDIPLLQEEHFSLASVISEKHFSSLGQALFSMIGGLPLKYSASVGADLLLKRVMKPSHQNYSKKYLVFPKDEERKEVYGDIVKLLQSGSVLLLFPEVSIAEEYHKMFSDAYGERVVLFHSELTTTEKINAWFNMMLGTNFIILGTRISIFCPAPDLRTIILDKGNDPSYREQRSPKYNASEIAELRCKSHDIPFIIGETALSVGARLDILDGKATYEAYNKENLPSVHTIFMNQKTTDKRISFFAWDTLSMFEETLLKDGKVAVLHNRKGSSKILKCEKCEHGVTCNTCNYGMVLSDDGKDLLCRFCKTAVPFNKKCPSCGSKKIGERVYGIEKIHKVLKEFYPDLGIIKFMGGMTDIAGNFNIAVGTSAIKKILKINKFSLLIIISGESFLNIPDYNSEEKFFIMTNEMRGLINNPDCKILIQTRSPNLEVYKALIENNSDIFYERELSIRKQLLYPPYSEMIKLEIKGVKKSAFERKKETLESFIKEKGYELFYSGPSFPPVKKGQGMWKYLLRFKESFDRKEIKRIAYETGATVESNPEQI
ncbi:MAG: replication restart helicase PriA [Candidatus Ratteibacteria bacterium]